MPPYCHRGAQAGGAAARPGPRVVIPRFSHHSRRPSRALPGFKKKKEKKIPRPLARRNCIPTPSVIPARGRAIAPETSPYTGMQRTHTSLTL